VSYKIFNVVVVCWQIMVFGLLVEVLFLCYAWLISESVVQ